MTSVLNPSLYRRLQRRFGRVVVANAGQAMVYRPARDLCTDAPRLNISQPGEQYRVCCAFCNDTRYRLYVSHMWGRRDDFGRRMTFLAKCFNEDCLSRDVNRENFIETLQEMDGPLEDAWVRPGKVLPEEAREVQWPGPVTRIDELPGRHKARHYLASRGFDPDKLGRVYGVTYCEESRYFLASERIIIPSSTTASSRAGRPATSASWPGRTRPKSTTCRPSISPARTAASAPSASTTGTG